MPSGVPISYQPCEVGLAIISQAFIGKRPEQHSPGSFAELIWPHRTTCRFQLRKHSAVHREVDGKT